MTHTPHDALFKAAFERPEHAAGEFRAVLPATLVERIRWETLSLEAGSFVDPALQQRHSDLLFSVVLASRPAFIYLLFEHQSRTDEFLAFRMLGYVVRIWERALRKQPDLLRLPAVLPFVLHHSDTGWTGPRRLSELLEPSPAELPELRGYLPEMGLLIDDISHVDDTTLRDRALAPFPSLALAALRDCRRPGKVLKSLAAWADALKVVSDAPDGPAALEQLFRYIALVAEELDLGELRSQISRLVPTAKAGIMTTIAERLIQQGREEGLKQGLDQGLDQGVKQGQATTLMRLLELKFGALDAASRERVMQADRALLDTWCERVLTAGSIADVLG